jgi:hypothetical protein
MLALSTHPKAAEAVSSHPSAAAGILAPHTAVVWAARFTVNSICAALAKNSFASFALSLHPKAAEVGGIFTPHAAVRFTSGSTVHAVFAFTQDTVALISQCIGYYSRPPNTNELRPKVGDGMKG